MRIISHPDERNIRLTSFWSAFSVNGSLLPPCQQLFGSRRVDSPGKGEARPITLSQVAVQSTYLFYLASDGELDMLLLS